MGKGARTYRPKKEIDKRPLIHMIERRSSSENDFNHMTRAFVPATERPEAKEARPSTYKSAHRSGCRVYQGFVKIQHEGLGQVKRRLARSKDWGG